MKHPWGFQQIRHKAKRKAAVEFTGVQEASSGFLSLILMIILRGVKAHICVHMCVQRLGVNATHLLQTLYLML